MPGLLRVSSLALASFALACSASWPRPPARQTRPLTVPGEAVTAPTPKPTFENPGGMWLPSQVPLKAEELKRLGLAVDPALLADPNASLLAAIVNLNGCSASFVSKEGLVVTNHHCATGALQHNSTPTQNLLELGMLAKSRAEERSSGPSSRLSVLSKMTEVTEQVRPALTQ